MAHERLVARISEITGRHVRGVRVLTGGLSNRTYLVLLAPPKEPRAVVVRVFAEEERASTEAAALRILEHAQLAGPRVLAEATLDGSWVVLTTRVPGRPVARPADRSWLDGLVATLVAIHRVEPHGSTLVHDPGGARPWIDEAPPVELGSTAYDVWPAIARRRAELDGPRVLSHFDFHAGNVHWSRGRVSGVIDWELARWAPATADVAYCYMDLALAAGRRVAERFLDSYTRSNGDAPGLLAWLLVAILRPLPDPADWLPSYEGAGWQGLSPELLRRRLKALARASAERAAG